MKHGLKKPHYTKLKISIIVSKNGEHHPYFTVVDLKGSKVWQNVQIAFANLKDENRMGIKDYENIDRIVKAVL